MRVIRTENYEQVSRKAADLIAAQVQLKPDCVLGLATGSSPEGAYAVLAEKCRAGEVDFSQVKTVNLDEYVGLAPDHTQSYARFMRVHLFDHVNIDQHNCHIPSGLMTDPEAACADYDRLIRSLGGIAFASRTTLTVLGTGFRGGTVDAARDHRIAMATAVAATVCREPVTVRGAEAVAKSYPRFWEVYQQLGGILHEQHLR